MSKNGAINIAVAGKGGTGKTTFSALVVRRLVEAGLKPVLAVDADANSNLNELLGLRYESTVSDILEFSLDGMRKLPAAMSKEQFMEMQLQGLVAEGSGFDLMVMGCPEGPSCYCYANNMLRKYVDTLMKSYRYVVMDNEAGMEHLSRKTTRDVDFLFLSSDGSKVGIKSAVRIYGVARKLKLAVGKAFLFVSRWDRDVLPPDLIHELDDSGLKVIGIIPTDPEVMDLAVKGAPIWELDADSAAYRAVGEIMSKTILAGDSAVSMA